MEDIPDEREELACSLEALLFWGSSVSLHCCELLVALLEGATMADHKDHSATG